MRDYIEAQHLVNSYHAIGLPEIPSDSYDSYDFAELLSEMGEPDPSSLLVIGCRLGYECRYFRQRWPSSDIMGVDIVPEFVTVALKEGPAQIADMHALPFKDHSYAWIYCVGTLEHGYDPARAAQEMLRVASHGIYVTADLEPFPSENASHWTCAEAGGEWEGLFSHPAWSIASRTVSDKTLQIVLLRDKVDA